MSKYKFLEQVKNNPSSELSGVENITADADEVTISHKKKKDFE